MKVKIIVIVIMALLITSANPVVGQVKDIAILNENNVTNPQNNGEKWMKTYGGRDFDFGTHVTETTDGGYIVVGTTSSYGSGSEDVWLIKTDYKGDLEWEKFYGGDDGDFGAYVQQTTDGGYIIIGSTGSYAVGKQDVWLIKTDENGEKLWDNTFGGIEFDRGHKVLETPDGGYVIIGNNGHTGGPRGDIWLLKTDSNGDLLWDQIFGGKGHNGGSCIDFTSDGGYIIVGSSYMSGETNSYDLWLIKTDRNGELIWDNKFEENNTDSGSSVQETTDGGFIVVGTTGYDHPYSNLLIIKTDGNGDVIWKKVIDEFAKDQRGVTVRETLDGGYIIVGETLFNNIFGFCPLIIKTNSLGEIEWSHHIIEFGNDCIFSVEQTNDEGFIFTGYKHSGLKHDLWIIKANSDGDIPINRAISISFFYWLHSHPHMFPILQLLIQRFGLQ
jgi:hypothetical protein